MGDGPSAMASSRDTHPDVPLARLWLAVRERWDTWDALAPRLGLAGLFALYFLLWGVISLLPLNPTDLDVFFFPSARIAAQGHPLLVYSLRYGQVYPNANGPLSLVPLTGVVLLAQHLGWAQN